MSRDLQKARRSGINERSPQSGVIDDHESSPVHTTPMKRTNVVLPIQYLRGIAALVVVWHHARGQLPGLSLLLPNEFGAHGVDLFFVISGFIMVLTTTGKEATPWQFFKRRLVRVAPLYWLVTTALVTLTVLAPNLLNTVKPTPGTTLMSLLFIPHLSIGNPGMVWPILVPGWTLNYEMFFYALFALSLFAPHPLVLLLSILAALVAFGQASWAVADPILTTYTSPLLLEFAVGACIGRLWIAAPPRWRWLQWRSCGLKALGDASYSIYLSHMFTLAVLRMMWMRVDSQASLPIQGFVFMPISLALCALVGWAVFRTIERPLLERLSSRRPPRP